MTRHLLGRYHAPETMESLVRLHRPAAGQALREADHEPRVGVLDQENLIAQGIDTSQLVPGAAKVDALGSCTANTVIEAISNLQTSADAFCETLHKALGAAPAGFDDVAAAERAAILFYHGCTDQTDTASSEWPPTDCGSSGPYIYRYALALGLIGSEVIAQHTAESILGLLQHDGLLLGTPWMQEWFEPDVLGFIDGNGTPDDLNRAIQSSVAGGHEVYISAIEHLATTPHGVDASKTVLRVRNHWGKWGDHGSFRVHLSTLLALGRYVDIRQFTH